MNSPGGTRSGRVRALAFGDGRYDFRLGIGELEELQEICDAGPMEILARLNAGTWRFRDVREAIRLGLVGGGLSPGKAIPLVERYVDDVERFPLAGNVPYAQAAVHGAVVGHEDEPLGEPEGEGAATTAGSSSPAESSGSPTTTDPAPPSGGRPPR